MEKVAGVFFGCSDVREELDSKVICRGANLLCKPMPGVDFGEPEKLLAYWQEYADPDWVAVFGPHKDCHWHSDEGATVMHAREYAEYFYRNGIPASCVLLGGKSPEMLLNHLKGHTITDRLEELFKKPGWGLTKDAWAEAVHIGRHFRSMRSSRVLRLSSPFVTDKIVSRMGWVLDVFRRDQVLPVRFSEEISLNEQKRVLGLFSQYSLPVVA